MTDPVAPPPKVQSGKSPLTRAAILLGAIALAIVLLLPIGVVAVLGDRFAANMAPKFSNIAGRLRIAEAVRPYAIPKDSSISAVQAGAAFHALPGIEQSTSFVLKPRPLRPALPWQEDSLPPELFPASHTRQYAGPNPVTILRDVSKGTSRDELEYLERIAHAAVWRDVNVIVRAPAVDIIGGRFVLPFPDSAALFEMPFMRFASIREIAYASVTRAAYHVARKQNDSAEYALRVIPSLGFALIDNGTSAIDQLIGAVIVGTGREALISYYEITHNPASEALKASRDSLVAALKAARDSSGRTTRAGMIAMIHDQQASRGARFEMLTQLAFVPCTNVRELMFGPRADVAETYAWARKNLARYPSEVALIDLASRVLAYDFTRREDDTAPGGFPVAIASLASTITRNHRLVACASIMTGMR